jgi:hypothetical protein
MKIGGPFLMFFVLAMRIFVVAVVMVAAMFRIMLFVTRLGA